MSTRYEILPFDSVEPEVAAVRTPLTITITCSPRHGLDRTVEFASRVAALGHQTVIHLAARAIRDAGHLDAVLGQLAEIGVDDVFVVAGDNREPAGPYGTAIDLLPVIAVHGQRPRRLGIAGYPEGHPLIGPETLTRALRDKAPIADYIVTQMCFDPATILHWLTSIRKTGVDLPVYVGMPGAVDRRRLLEVSMRVGVGQSVAFVRKQRSIGQLLRRPSHATDQLHSALSPFIGDTNLGLAGFHFFTFNHLSATLAQDEKRAASQPFTYKSRREL